MGKASAKGRLSRARSGREVEGGKEGRGERERTQHARQPKKHNRHTDTEQHNKILFPRLLVCTVGEDGGRSWGRSPVAGRGLEGILQIGRPLYKGNRGQ